MALRSRGLRFCRGRLDPAGPVLADSDRPDLENGTGDDPTKPLGKIELLERYTAAPGPGVAEGTTKSVETNTPFARIDVPFRLSPQWELNFRTEIPVVWTNGVSPENRTGATVSGFGDVLGQAWIVHDLDQRWAVALGGQLIAPTATNSVATDAWEQVTGVVVRAMLPEISPGSDSRRRSATELISKATTTAVCCGSCGSPRPSTSTCRTTCSSRFSQAPTFG